MEKQQLRQIIFFYLSLILILTSAVLIAYHIIVEQTNSCTSDPLRYTANSIAKYDEVKNYNSIYFVLYNDGFIVAKRDINLNPDSNSMDIR